MFKDEKEFKNFVDKLNIDTKNNSAHREKLKKQMLSIFEETSKKHTTGQHKPDLWRIIMKSPFIKIAAAAVIIIGILLLFLYAANNQNPQNNPEKNIVQENNDNNQIITPDTNKQDDELLLAKQLFENKDIAGLSELLNSDFKTIQIQVAEYLGQIGDKTVLPELQILADNWDGLEQDNVYANAISDIKERLSEIELEPEPNEPSQVTKVDTEPNELSTPIQEIKTGVAGIVIDKDTLEPIVGALVSNSSNMKISEVLTDNDGQFILPFSGIIKEERITIKASGYASQESMARIEEGRITEISVQLTRGIKISGIVIDPNNKPVSWAKVQLAGDNKLRINRPVITGEDGIFEFEGIDPVFTLPPSIRVNHPLYPQVLVQCQTNSTGKNIYKEIILTPGVLVFGKVTDPNGKALIGVIVGNTKATSTWNAIKCETDTEGMYVLDNVDLGELTLWVFDKKFAPYVLNTVLNPNQSKQQIDIQLSAPTEFKGIVLDKNHNPITKAYPTIQGYNGVKGITSPELNMNSRFRCNEKGEFIIPNMSKEGILEINIEGIGIPFKLRKVDLSLGEQVFIVEQLIPGTMYGKVIDAKTGEPVPKFHVKMNASYSGGNIGGYNASWNDPGYSFNSPEGYFDTGRQGINVGSYFRITVSAKGYNPVMNDLVPVQPISDNPQRTVFTLEQSMLHFGRVISVEGKPIKNAEILFHHNNIPLITEDLPRTTTDSNGIFSIFELGSDFDIMEVRAANYAPDIFLMKEITISEGRLKDIVLNYGANLHGYVYDENGKPVVNANIYSRYDPQKTGNAKRISQIRSNINNAYTDATGYYELSNIPVGKIEVDVYGDQYEQKKFIEIKTGQNLELNFEKDSQTEQKIKTN